MLQNLPKERFGLKFHREMQEIDTYALIVPKEGPKFKRATSAGEMTDKRLPDTVYLRDISSLVAFLSKAAGRPILDETGLKGEFSISVDLRGYRSDPSGDQAAAQSASERPPDAQRFDDFVMAAALEQTGLRFEKHRKAKVEMNRIDGMTKPNPADN